MLVSLLPKKGYFTLILRIWPPDLQNINVNFMDKPRFDNGIGEDETIQEYSKIDMSVRLDTHVDV